MSITRRTILGVSLPALAGCVSSLRHFPFDSGLTADGPGLEITYYSVGCFLLRWHGVSVLTDPFWSHLSVSQVAVGRAASDPAQVDPYLSELSTVQGVLVGHSHYDHMLDLPYVAPHLAPNAVVLGGQTLRHTLAPLDLPLEFVDMNDHLATPERMGTWHSIAGGRVRVMAIASGHPNNYAFVHLWTGVLSADRAAAPERAADYLEGITLAYLVDFLSESGEIAHRIYVQTSSRGWPDGFFPPALLEERPVDVALLAMDCANISAQERPRPILDFLQPKSVIFCHWENFFRTKQQSPRDIVKVNLPRLKRWFDQHATQPVYFPGWDTRYQFSDPP